MLSKSRLQAVFEQFLAMHPMAVFDAEMLATFALQGLFHLEVSGFGSGPTPVTGELALTASEVLASKLKEDDELVFSMINPTTVRAEWWEGTNGHANSKCSTENSYDVFPLSDAMIALAKKVVGGKHA